MIAVSGSRGLVLFLACLCSLCCHTALTVHLLRLKPPAPAGCVLGIAASMIVWTGVTFMHVDWGNGVDSPDTLCERHYSSCLVFGPIVQFLTIFSNYSALLWSSSLAHAVTSAALNWKAYSMKRYVLIVCGASGPAAVVLTTWGILQHGVRTSMHDYSKPRALISFAVPYLLTLIFDLCCCGAASYELNAKSTKLNAKGLFWAWLVYIVACVLCWGKPLSSRSRTLSLCMTICLLHTQHALPIRCSLPAAALSTSIHY